MPTTYTIHRRPPTTFVRSAFLALEIKTFDLPGASPKPVPLDEEDALWAEADRGWIDVRAARTILASASAAGAQATFTAEIRAGETAPPVALALADGVIASGAHELLISGETTAAYIRFLVAGTASAGVNTINLYLIAKG